MIIDTLADYTLRISDGGCYVYGWREIWSDGAVLSVDIAVWYRGDH